MLPYLIIYINATTQSSLEEHQHLWETVWLNVLLSGTFFFFQPCSYKLWQKKAVCAGYCRLLQCFALVFETSYLSSVLRSSAVAHPLKLILQTLAQVNLFELYPVLGLAKAFPWGYTILFKYAWCSVELHNRQTSMVCVWSVYVPIAPILSLMQLLRNCDIHTYTRMNILGCTHMTAQSQHSP